MTTRLCCWVRKANCRTTYIKCYPLCKMCHHVCPSSLWNPGQENMEENRVAEEGGQVRDFDFTIYLWYLLNHEREAHSKQHLFYYSYYYKCHHISAEKKECGKIRCLSLRSLYFKGVTKCKQLWSCNKRRYLLARAKTKNLWNLPETVKKVLKNHVIFEPRLEELCAGGL